MSERGVVRHLWALEAPTATVDTSICQVLTGGAQITIPLPSFLIEHEHGLLMFDTGLAANAAGDPRREYGELAEAFPFEFPEKHRLDRQLADLGFSTSDVSRVVLSHAHFDHTGGLAHFPDATGFIGAGELQYSRSPGVLDAGFYRPSDFDGGPSHWHELPTGYDHDVFGDGSVTTVSLPGHTVGSLGLRVRLPGRTIVLTGDAAHLQSNIDQLAPTPVDVNTENTVSSLRRLRAIADQPGTTVWVNHDPDQWAEHRKAGAEIL